MHVTVPCHHCGRSLRAPREFLGRKVRCVFCQGEFPLADPDPRPSPAPRPPDRTLSRSMLIKVPNARPAPADAMTCRLEPETLRMVDASAGFLDFLGPESGGRGRPFLEAIHPDDRALAEDEVRQAVELGERHDLVLRARREGGDYHYLRVYTQARYEPDGTVDHVRCSFRDVTDRVRAEEELRRRTGQLTETIEKLRDANRKLRAAQGQLVHSEKLAALGTLAAGMAHEINNPLAFATNNVAVLGRDLGMILEILGRYQDAWPALAGADPGAASAIARLQDEADVAYLRENLPRLVESTRRGLGRVAQIVKNLRAFANLDRGDVGEIDVNESVELGLGLIGDRLARERIAVSRDLGEVPRIEGAPAHLNQVFLNLLMNAMQAIEATRRESGTIRVKTRPDPEGGAVVEVSDDGVGIPPEVRPHIFDPFFTTRPVGSGSGLGLSLAHGIVADHRGTIEVESRPGGGTTFRVRLPTRR